MADCNNAERCPQIDTDSVQPVHLEADANAAQSAHLKDGVDLGQLLEAQALIQSMLAEANQGHREVSADGLQADIERMIHEEAKRAGERRLSVKNRSEA